MGAAMILGLILNYAGVNAVKMLFWSTCSFVTYLLLIHLIKRRLMRRLLGLDS
jgi:hypothetical protein